MCKKWTQWLFGIASGALAAVMVPTLYLQSTLPDRFLVTPGEELVIQSDVNLQANPTVGNLPLEVYSSAGNTYRADLTILGGIKVKTVTVQIVERQSVTPCGTPFGIKMFTDGVMVVGMSDVQTQDGRVNPAKDAGLRMGDLILTMNGQQVTSNSQVGEILSASDGKPITVVFRRGDQEQTVTLTPAYSKTDAGYKAGMWVRDSSAGIGTLTFYDDSNNVFAGLGHAICDADTGDIMPLLSGEIVNARITGVEKGASGDPGELKGMFVGEDPLGVLEYNGETGVYGTLNRVPVSVNRMEVSYRQEVKEGEAKILTTIDGTTPQEYDIQIEKINFSDTNPTKNMVIRITDPDLLEKTGGIVQGMSGSPIIQDGRLVGAVTHVFVNDPTRGYGIFAENMLNTATNLAKELPQAS